MLEGILRDMEFRLDELKRLCDKGEKPSAMLLFDRDFLRRLAALSEDDYRRFKNSLTAEFYWKGLEGKLADVPTEQKLDRMVQNERDKMEREGLPCRVGEFLPDAPEPDRDFLIPAGWLLRPEGLFRAGTDGPGEMVAASPVWVSARVRDAERGREELVLLAKVDGEWRRVFVSASATKNQLRQGLSGAGVLVLNPKALERYVSQFRLANDAIMPIRSVEEESESLFDRFSRFVEENRQKFEGGIWGRPVEADGESCLAVFPDRLERFLKKEGASLRAVLAAWKDLGYLKTRGGYLYQVKTGGRTRRMAVFSRELLLPEDAKAGRT